MPLIIAYVCTYSISEINVTTYILIYLFIYVLYICRSWSICIFFTLQLQLFEYLNINFIATRLVSVKQLIKGKFGNHIYISDMASEIIYGKWKIIENVMVQCIDTFIT